MWLPPNKIQLRNREKWFELLEDSDAQQVRGALFGHESNTCRLTDEKCGCAIGLAYKALGIVVYDRYETGTTMELRRQLGFYTRTGETDIFLHEPYMSVHRKTETPEEVWTVMAMNDAYGVSLPDIAAHLRKQPVGTWTGVRKGVIL